MQKESALRICDNTTAQWLRIFHVYRPGNGPRGAVGYIFFGSVRRALPVDPRRAPAVNLRRGRKVQGQLIRLRLWVRRPDGQQLRCGENAGILVRARMAFRGARVAGPIVREAGRTKLLARGVEVV